MKTTRIMLFVLFGFLRGHFAYGDDIADQTITYQGREYVVDFVDVGRWPSHIAFQRSLDGRKAEWEKQIWLHPSRDIVLTDDRRLPARTRILIPVERVKTKFATVENKTPKQLCKGEADCPRLITRINYLPSTDTVVNGRIWVLKHLDTSTVAAKAPDEEKKTDEKKALPPAPKPADYWFTPNLLHGLWIASIILLAATLAAIAALVLVRKHRAGGTIIPVSFNPISERREKLKLIRQDIIYRVNQTEIKVTAASFTVNPWRKQITHVSFGQIHEIEAVLRDTEHIYAEAAATYQQESYKSTLIFPRLANVSLGRLREIGEQWIAPEMVGYYEKFIVEFIRDLPDPFNPELFKFHRDLNVAEATFQIRIVPVNGNRLEEQPMEDLIHETTKQLNDPRFDIKGFEYQDGVGIAEFIFKGA